MPTIESGRERSRSARRRRRPAARAAACRASPGLNTCSVIGAFRDSPAVTAAPRSSVDVDLGAALDSAREGA
jgi:hypothetical protein